MNIRPNERRIPELTLCRPMGLQCLFFVNAIRTCKENIRRIQIRYLTSMYAFTTLPIANDY